MIVPDDNLALIPYATIGPLPRFRRNVPVSSRSGRLKTRRRHGTSRRRTSGGGPYSGFHGDHRGRVTTRGDHDILRRRRICHRRRFVFRRC